MKGWIKLNILSYTEESARLEKLELDNALDYAEFKAHLIQVSNISSIPLDIDKSKLKGNCLIYTNGTCIETKETLEEITDLINNA